MLKKLSAKRIINVSIDALEGVSTLDVVRETVRIIPSLLTLFILSGIILGAPGHSTLDIVDPQFNPQVQTNSFGQKEVTAIVPLPDGKILVGGKFTSYNRIPVGTLVRLNSDGSLDGTFNMILDGSKGSENRVAYAFVQSDGKIIVRVSNFSLGGQTSTSTIIRLHPDGDLDDTFEYKGGDQISHMAVDDSDRILFASSFGNTITRLNPDGSFDTVLNVQNGPTSIIYFTTRNNKIIVAYSESGQQNPGSVRRFNENGTVDKSFSVYFPNEGFVQADFQPDNKILIMLARTVIRLNEDGTPDTSFNTINYGNITQVIHATPDGSFIVGMKNQYIFRKYLPDGTIDASYTPYTFDSSNSNFSLSALQPDGSLIFGDYIFGIQGSGVPNAFSKALPDGMPDTSFNSGGVGFQTFLPGDVSSLAVQSDDKVLIGGNFGSVNEILRIKIARLNADATVDQSFNINLSGADGTFSAFNHVYNVTVQSDQKILVSGNFTYRINGEVRQHLVRLNTDGSIDTGFNLNVQFTDAFGCCGGGQIRPVPLSDGRYVVAKSRLNIPQDQVPIKLSAGGLLDETFVTNLFPAAGNVYIRAIAVQPDEKILVSGTETSSGTQSFVVRLNSDGSIDNTFQTSGNLTGNINSLNILPDGKILISNPNNNLQQLNSDGSPDNTFNSGTGANGTINTVLRTTNGDVFVGGDFSTFDGEMRNNLAKLDPDGTLSPIVYNINGEVLALATDSLGRLIVSGKFTTITVGTGNPNFRSYAARLIDKRIGKRLDFDGDGKEDIATYSNNGIWDVFNSQTNQSSLTQFGLSTDKTVPADFDGDGISDIAVYRPSEGNWYINQSTEGFAVYHWGIAEDIPVPADYDGDGKADLVVWRPSTGVWYIYKSSDNQWTAIKFGLDGDIPLQSADFDGDGTADIAVWRPSNGNFYWLESGSDNLFRVVHFGISGDIPSVGDFNGDGKTDLVVFRPSQGIWYQYLTDDLGGYTYTGIQFGLNGDEPIAADYDGDGKTDIAVRRANTWHILSTQYGYTLMTYGNSESRAVAALFN